MSLIEAMMDKCIIMNAKKEPDGQGGFYTEWEEGVEVDVAIVQDTSMSARVAEKEGVTSTYTLTTKKDVRLDYHDVIKRIKDGRFFRVTSMDKESPDVAIALNMRQVSAERWELTQ